MWYGWIPVLNESVFGIRTDRPVETPDRFILLEDGSNGSLRFAYNGRDDIATEITVTVESGFLRMDGLDQIENRQAYSITQSLYNILKKSYHVDITHHSGDGLTVVQANNITEATVRTAAMIVNDCESFPVEAELMLDVETLRIVYLKSLGLIEYGMFFIKSHAWQLGLETERYLQRLASVSRFIDAIYGTRRDAIQDEVAKQSRNLARSAERLSFVVMAISLSSIILSCSAFLFDYQEIEGEILFGIIFIAVVVPAGMIAYAF